MTSDAFFAAVLHVHRLASLLTQARSALTSLERLLEYLALPQVTATDGPLMAL